MNRVELFREIDKICSRTEREMNRRTDFLYAQNPNCGFCHKLIQTRSEADLVDEARGPEYLIHHSCFSAWLQSLLRRSIRVAKGSPDLRLVS